MSEVKINSNTGIGGGTFTSSVSNDQLSNEDFLKLMIQELKLQDPTKPMDSQRMMATQMQMSTVDTNLKMVQSMKSLENSIANMTLSNAITFMGKKVDALVDKPILDENGIPTKNADGKVLTEKVKASYLINTVKVENGKTYLESSELKSFVDVAANNKTKKVVSYNSKTGQIKNPDGSLSEYYFKLNKDGRFEKTSTGDIIITDKDGKVIRPTYKDDKTNKDLNLFSFVKTEPIYSKNNTNIEYKDIVKVY